MKRREFEKLIKAFDAAAGAFKEDDHPRDESGKFTAGAGGSKGASGSAGKNQAINKFDLAGKKREDCLGILSDQISRGGDVGAISEFLHDKISGGSSVGKAMNEAKEKFKGSSDEGDAMLHSFYCACKGPQWNSDFNREYSGDGYKERSKKLEAEADKWLDE